MARTGIRTGPIGCGTRFLLRAFSHPVDIEGGDDVNL